MDAGTACLLEDLLPATEAQTDSGGGPGTADAPVLQGFGTYMLLEEVGRVGMGVIYKARRPGVGRLRARVV